LCLKFGTKRLGSVVWGLRVGVYGLGVGVCGLWVGVCGFLGFTQAWWRRCCRRRLAGAASLARPSTCKVEGQRLRVFAPRCRAYVKGLGFRA
jgi:hypothetical protein